MHREKNSNFIDYFDYLYSYPPKFKIKWDAIDEFKGRSFLQIQLWGFRA